MNLTEPPFMAFGRVVRTGRFNKFLDFSLLHLHQLFSSVFDITGNQSIDGTACISLTH